MVCIYCNTEFKHGIDPDVHQPYDWLECKYCNGLYEVQQKDGRLVMVPADNDLLQKFFKTVPQDQWPVDCRNNNFLQP